MQLALRCASCEAALPFQIPSGICRSMARELRGIVATTHVDLQNERLTLGALEGIVEQSNQCYIPLNIEHDPRLPPVGRVTSAKIVPLPDGEFGVETTSELFDGTPLAADGREVKVRTYQGSQAVLGYDYSYYSKESVVAQVEQVAAAANMSPQTMAKKALVPLSELVIGAGIFIAGSLASGFIGKLGSDGMDALRKGIKRLLATQQDVKERLVTFDFTCQRGDHLVSVEVILTNPSDDGIDAFIDFGLGELDAVVLAAKVPDDVRKVVLAYGANGFSLLYGIRKDGVPIS